MRTDTQWLVAAAALVLSQSACRPTTYPKFRPESAGWARASVAPTPPVRTTPVPVEIPVELSTAAPAAVDEAPPAILNENSIQDSIAPDTATSRLTVARGMPAATLSPAPAAPQHRKLRGLRIAGAVVGGAAVVALGVGAASITLGVGLAFSVLFLVGGAGVLVVRKLAKRPQKSR